MRTATGLSGAPALALSAWRGVSGKRYVVGVHAIEAVQPAELTDAVVIAVRRDEAGLATLVRASYDLIAESAAGWIASMIRADATEVHVHRLASTADERAAIVVDLSPAATPDISLLASERGLQSARA
ncbi:hypothetical protein F6X53_22740 [Methylobacterium soli]|uniref:Uncharacterized protein n=1 Tax=Methylobacterium soli TaxID=553447 RepID=A0A6L3SSR6_9HYPH|nr:hypothetical protein F6X53_22740 [Methylobacterium soli]